MESEIKNNNSKYKEGIKCQQIQNRDNQHMDLIDNFWLFHENVCKRLK